ncbi:MAG: PaaI family thioesterase [Caulobacteraceae bacterium]|nr:PaaI family thioesterase [Caulobacteraceae bacterium]
MPDTQALREAIAKLEVTPSLSLTPFAVEAADFAGGSVRLLFEPRPDFANRFGVTQGGLAMAMMDVALSIAAYAGTGAFTPTVEIKASFLAPLPIGPIQADARVLRAGRTLVFLEGALSTPGEAPAITATATTIRRAG